MKTLFFLLISCSFGFTQNSTDNYITYQNYANEAEYNFLEQDYDSAVYYFELGFEFASELNPAHLNKYARALWKTEKRKQTIKVLKDNYHRIRVDTNWFSGLNSAELERISKKRAKLKARHKSSHDFYKFFIDSIMILDQAVRQLDRNENFYKELGRQDSLNGLALIEFARKYGFPAGKNYWGHDAATFLLHMPPEWFVENYSFLIKEVIKGNLEPWMLARGIDRMFTVEIGEDKINPYNRYWNKGIIDPFLMFQNCISLGVSPYYDFNWTLNAKKTIHFDYYKANKKHYNTTIMYPHNKD